MRELGKRPKIAVQSVGEPVDRKTRAFGRDEKGSVAIIFGLTSFIVMALIGGAVDYGRAVTARSQMQNALDAAVLAGARIWQVDKDLAHSEEQTINYYNENGPKGVSSAVTSFTPDLNNNSITIEATGTIPAPFLSAAAAIGRTLTGSHSASDGGSPEYILRVRAQALLAAGGNGDSDLEVAMMLDVTGSMSGSKINDLKEAAKDLINIVIWDDQSTRTSRVALVPFADAVNVGSTSLVEDVRGDLKSGSCTSSGSACTDFTSGSPSSKQWTTGAPARYFKFTNMSRETQTWQASSYCVTERIGAERYTDAAPDTASRKVAPLYGASSSSSCGYMSINTRDMEVNTIQPLSNDKAMLSRRIDKLQAAGPTAGQIGTAWAWYMLSPKWGYLWPNSSRPVAYNTDKTQKIAILMTDGEYNTGHCHGIIAQDSGSGSGSSGKKINCDADNDTSANQATQLCTAMKNDTGITVYTVGFALGGNKTATKILRNCASDETKFYEAENGSELRMAFRDIALQLAKLRLSQ